ncbi:hypothetical protein [Streptomyces sp. NPDC090025]|uniref:hypothetical protein n=1 Tax=Streptomyces sp. NPDC090025 TaxID=3365922 RepID=UPI0038357F7E
MASKFEASADDVIAASNVLRDFTTNIRNMLQRYRDGVDATDAWPGEGDDEFAKVQRPIYLEQTQKIQAALDGFTEVFLALADGTVKNANEYINRQEDVLSSIRQEHNGQSGPRG